MNTLSLRIGLSLIAVATSASASAAAVIADASFEKPALATGSYEYGVQNGAQHSSNGVNAKSIGVTFSNGAGVKSNGSAWSFSSAPAGRQAAFLQSYANQVPGRITLAVTGLIPGKHYAVGFSCANRPGYGTDPVNVSFEGIALGSFTPASTRWSRMTTDSFEAAASKGTITLSVEPGGDDRSIDIDDLAITEIAR